MCAENWRRPVSFLFVHGQRLVSDNSCLANNFNISLNAKWTGDERRVIVLEPADQVRVLRARWSNSKLWHGFLIYSVPLTIRSNSPLNP
jgi:hypothetical protein